VPDDIEPRVRRLVAEVLGLAEADVTNATSSETVADWDSLAVMNLLMSVEGEFAVAVSPEDVANFTSVESIVATVRALSPQ
jgi:acyl carrier protein